jgi:TonB-linked SusC/RagA family outer membrane protein
MTAKEVRKNPARTFLSLLATGLFVAGATGLVTAAPAAAQTGAITGTITSAQTGEPLSAAQISIEGTGLGTLTQANGRYLILRVPAGTYTVNAILIGFANASTTVTVSDGESAVADIRLEPQAISLSEIVVTGVAGATQRTKLPFDVTQVRVADLPVPQSNAAQALQGKVAGATVVQGSGRPGSAPSILLRGVTSLDASGRDQEPLYIVDGVIMSGTLVDLDALDIQSIEVVKGAAAASLYGSRAGAGVIQIRTKRGAQIADDQVRYTFRNEYGGSDLAFTPELLLSKKHRFQLSPDGTQFVDNDGTYCTWLDCSQPRESGANAWSTYQENVWPGQTFDQVERFFTNGNYLQSNLSAEGRSGRTNFHVSASRLDQEGILRFTPGFKRSNFRVNVDQSVVDNLTIQSSVFYSKSTQGNREGPLFDLTRMPAGIDLLAEDPDHPGDVILAVNPTDSESDNPIYELQNYSQTQERSRFLGSVNARYSPMDWLNLDGNVSFDRLDRDDQSFREKGFRCTEPCTTFTAGTLYKYRLRDEAVNASVTASARWNVTDQIRNTTQARYLYENDDYNWFDTYGYGFAVGNVPTFRNIDQSNVTADSYLRTVRADGYFLITNFDMYDKYVVDALIRNDGSSLFGADERRQWYYRFAGAWRLSQEDFFNIPGVDELKLRYALGTAGGRPNFESQYETYNVSGGIISPVSLGNKNLKPEFSTEHEAGLDMSLFNSKMTANLTYAFNTTKDQILPVPQPSYTGFRTQWRNAGTVESKTWEATLDFRLLERPSFNWSAKLLYDHTKSTITELTVPPFVYGVAGQQLGEVFYARAGEEVGTFYGGILARTCADLPSDVSCDGFQVDDHNFLVWTGGSGFDTPQWGTTGPAVGGSNVMWGTPFGGFCIDRSTGEPTRSCKVGNTMPDYNFGVSTTMTLKGLSLYALVNRSAGFDVYNQPLQWGFFKRATAYYDQDAGLPANEKKPLGYWDAWYSGSGGLGPNNEFVEDGTFTKLREVSLSYRLRQDQLGGIPGLDRFQGIGISVTGRNLYTWTNYRGYDPEIGKTGGDTGSAAIARVDGYTYPNFRTWTAALELIF